MKTNEDLHQEVVDEIKWDPQLQDVSSQIEVSVKDGVVTLSGIVDSYGNKMAAERAAQRVKGVKIVACDLEVDSVRKKTDAELAEAVEAALHWNNAINEDKIKVLIDDGWIYLDGTVDWEYERTFAQRSLENLIGIRGITNNISIKLRTTDPQEIKQRITEAFRRSATVDSSGITVEAAGNKVTLTGKVRSWSEKKDAERVARWAPGVTEVDNKIEIDISAYS
jgi:osmotically-inducible protein OsmY